MNMNNISNISFIDSTDADEVGASKFWSAPHQKAPEDISAVFNQMEGSGTESNPYVVTNDWELQAMNQSLGAHYVLGRNIDASGTANWNAGTGFIPIGASFSNAFQGTFDGQGYEINGLTVNQGFATNNLGLFGMADSGAEITNVGLTGVDISGAEYIGGLVGRNQGSVKNSYVTGKVSMYSHTSSDRGGGLIGYNDGGSVTRSFSSARVIIAGAGGGLIGVNSGSVSSSYATGIVDRTTNADVRGGLIGENWDSGTVTTSFFAGSLLQCCTIDTMGGLIASNSGSVSDSYWDVNTSMDSSAGGTGLYTSQMKGLDAAKDGNMQGFDFTGTWKLRHNDYPVLSWEEEASKGFGEFVKRNGDSMQGVLNMNTYNITGIGGLNGCANDEYVDGVGDCEPPGGQTETLAETLTAGNVANQTIEFDSSIGIQIGDDSSSTNMNEDIAIGNGASASGVDGGFSGDSFAISLGEGSEASISGSYGGLGALAIGRGSSATAVSNNVMAIGPNSNAEGSSMAIGPNSNASALDSMVIAPGSTPSEFPEGLATGSYSTVLGANAEASGEASMAFGRQAKASNSYEATFGNLDNDQLDVNVTGNLTVHGVGGLNVRNGYVDINAPVNTGAALDVGGAVNADGGIDTYDDIDLNGNNITDSAKGNVTVGQDLKVFGDLWLGNADLAEAYTAEDDVGKAEIVMTGSSGKSVRTASETGRSSILGVVSTEPAITLNSGEEGVRVALVGRVPLKVNLENGPIEIGDPVTVSSTPGVGMRAVEPGMVVGTALEPFNRSSDSNKISVFVNPRYHVEQGTVESLREENQRQDKEIDQLTDLVCQDHPNATVCG